MIDEDVGIAGFDQALAKTIGILRECKGFAVIALVERDGELVAVLESCWPHERQNSLEMLMRNAYKIWVEDE